MVNNNFIIHERYENYIKNKVYYSDIFVNKEIIKMFKLKEIDNLLHDDSCSILILEFEPTNKKAINLLEIRESLKISYTNYNKNSGIKSYLLFNEFWCGQGVDILFKSSNLNEIIYYGYKYLEVLLQKYNEKLTIFY